MNRRNFFKKVGKGVLVAPFIPLLKMKVEGDTTDELNPRFVRTNVRKTISTGTIECRLEGYDPSVSRWRRLPNTHWRKINE